MADAGGMGQGREDRSELFFLTTMDTTVTMGTMAFMDHRVRRVRRVVVSSWLPHEGGTGVKRGCMTSTAVAAFLLMSGPAAAHHGSSAAYANTTVQLTGTVTEFVWANPHTRIFIDVAGTENKVVNWGIELRPAPAGLSRMGWTRHTFQPGDKISVTVSPSRFGTPTGVAETNFPVLKNGEQLPGTGQRRGGA